MLLRYARSAAAPEERVRVFVHHDPRVSWVPSMLQAHPHADVLLTGPTLRDVLMGHVPHTVHATAVAVRPKQLRSHLAQHGDLTVEDQDGETLTFTPKGSRSGAHVGYDAPERKDFSIDNLWYSARNHRLLDPHGGLDDLHQRRIRVLGYPLRTFADDPLKALRALRLAAERRLTFAPETWHALTRSLPRLNKIVRDEDGKAAYAIPRKILGASFIETLAHEPRYGAALMHASGYGELLAKDLFTSEVAWEQAVKAVEHLIHEHTVKGVGLRRLSSTVLLAALLAFHERKLELARKLVRDYHLQQFPVEHFAHVQAQHLHWLLENIRMFDTVDPAGMTPSAFEKVFGSAKGRELLALMHAIFLTEGKHHVARERLHVARRLLDALHHRAAPKLLRGRDLVALGIHPGPAYRQLLAKVRDAQLAGSLRNREDALAFARLHIAHL